MRVGVGGEEEHSVLHPTGLRWQEAVGRRWRSPDLHTAPPGPYQSSAPVAHLYLFAQLFIYLSIYSASRSSVCLPGRDAGVHISQWATCDRRDGEASQSSQSQRSIVPAAPSFIRSAQPLPPGGAAMGFFFLLFFFFLIQMVSSD